MKKSVLIAATAAIAANPVMAHMRRIAYSDPDIPKSRSNFKENEEAKEKAEEKRLRKQQRNIKNAQT